MLNTSIQGAVATKILDTISAANTAAATSGWVAVGAGEGDVLFTLYTGAVTGSLASILQTADDSGGTGVRTVTFSDGTAAFTGISAANKIESKTVDRKALGTHVKFVGTVTTGPILIAFSMHVPAKYA
jgi:hypothetical protein